VASCSKPCLSQNCTPVFTVGKLSPVRLMNRVIEKTGFPNNSYKIAAAVTGVLLASLRRFLYCLPAGQ
jgi:hypothetical protein